MNLTQIENHCQILWSYDHLKEENGKLVGFSYYNFISRLIFWIKDQLSAGNETKKVNELVLKTLQGISDQLDSEEECPCFFFRINQSGDQVGYTYAEFVDRISHLPRFSEDEDIMSQAHSIITNMNSLALGSELDGLSEEDKKNVRQSIIEIMTRKSLMKSFSVVEREVWISSSLKKVKLLAYKGYCYTNIKPIDRNLFNSFKGNSFDLLQLTGKYQTSDVEEEKDYEVIWKRPCKMVIISTKSGITIGARPELELE